MESTNYLLWKRGKEDSLADRHDRELKRLLQRQQQEKESLQGSLQQDWLECQAALAGPKMVPELDERFFIPSCKYVSRKKTQAHSLDLQDNYDCDEPLPDAQQASIQTKRTPNRIRAVQATTKHNTRASQRANTQNISSKNATASGRIQKMKTNVNQPKPRAAFASAKSPPLEDQSNIMTNHQELETHVSQLLNGVRVVKKEKRNLRSNTKALSIRIKNEGLDGEVSMVD
ncbi:hypothetical protein B0J14DRAFT_648787 [Halenospora varia]|nr:hypothetical protein B0J14DRAFT_648787 [Halenospora varia]